MSVISGFCEKCNGFRKIYCDGDRNTCMSILFDTIESLQLENERLADETIKLMKENAKNSNKKDELVKVLKQAREVLYNLKMDDYPGFSAICEALAEIDKVMGGKDDERKPV